MTHRTNRQVVLAEAPQGRLSPEHFRFAEAEAPTLGEGEALLRTRYVAVDAANRVLQATSYRGAVSVGDVMPAYTLAEVVESWDERFTPGDLVLADTGWQDYAVRPADRLTKVDKFEPITRWLSAYGTAGLTAYFGLLECGKPEPGQTVLVSAAAGAVGSFVGQIAKLKGCRVVGIAGGAMKCEFLTRELGFDAAVDYKSAGGDPNQLYMAIAANCPEGADVYFDNVGGLTADLCLANLKAHGRIACCGAVSFYDTGAGYPGPTWALIVSKRATLQGFIVSEFYARRAEAVAELKGWVESGSIKVFEDVIDGLERLPEALVGLLAGENIGKRIVKVA